MEELHEKKEQLSRKERELIDAKRKKSQMEMEKETLEESMARMREADSWQRMSPRAALLGIGDISFDAATSPAVRLLFIGTFKTFIQWQYFAPLALRNFWHGSPNLCLE